MVVVRLEVPGDPLLTGVLVDCGRGQLCITQLQLPGGRTLGAQQVLHARGKLFAAGKRFDTPLAATSA